MSKPTAKRHPKRLLQALIPVVATAGLVLAAVPVAADQALSGAPGMYRYLDAADLDTTLAAARHTPDHTHAVMDRLPGAGIDGAFSGGSSAAPLSAVVPGGVQDRSDRYTRIRGVQLRNNLWLGTTKTNDGWEGGLVVRQGDTTMAFNHRGATVSLRF